MTLSSKSQSQATVSTLRRPRKLRPSLFPAQTTKIGDPMKPREALEDMAHRNPVSLDPSILPTTALNFDQFTFESPVGNVCY
jgi:hypothetical protein